MAARVQELEARTVIAALLSIEWNSALVRGATDSTVSNDLVKAATGGGVSEIEPTP